MVSGAARAGGLTAALGAVAAAVARGRVRQVGLAIDLGDRLAVGAGIAVEGRPARPQIRATPGQSGLARNPAE